MGRKRPQVGERAKIDACSMIDLKSDEMHDFKRKDDVEEPTVVLSP